MNNDSHFSTHFSLNLDHTSAPSNNETTGTMKQFTTRFSEQILVVILIIFALYIFIASAWYQVQFSQEDFKWTNRLCFASGTLLLFQSLLYLIDVYGRNIPHALCSIYMFIGVILGLLSRYLVYVVLWIRQRIFYNNPFYKSWKFIPFISWLTLLGMSSLLVPAVLSFMQISRTRGTARGCEVSPMTKNVLLLGPICYAVFTFFQLVLVFLIVYPVCIHLKKNNRNVKMRSAIFRLTKCTVACVTTDILFFATIAIRAEGASSSFVSMIFNFNSVVNAIALLASFSDHWKRLIPFIPCIRIGRHSRPEPDGQAVAGDNHV